MWTCPRRVEAVGSLDAGPTPGPIIPIKATTAFGCYLSWCIDRTAETSAPNRTKEEDVPPWSLRTGERKGVRDVPNGGPLDNPVDLVTLYEVSQFVCNAWSTYSAPGLRSAG